MFDWRPVWLGLTVGFRPPVGVGERFSRQDRILGEHLGDVQRERVQDVHFSRERPDYHVLRVDEHRIHDPDVKDVHALRVNLVLLVLLVGRLRETGISGQRSQVPADEHSSPVVCPDVGEDHVEISGEREFGAVSRYRSGDVAKV